MDARARLDQLQAAIRRKAAIDMDASREQHEAGRIIRAHIPDDGERRTALHEAGHAAAMEVLSIGCRSAHTYAKGQARAEWGTGTPSSPRARAVAIMAGSLAEDGTLDNMSDQDRKLLNDEVEKLRRDPQASGNLDIVESLRREARRLVSTHHDAISDVAAHLQEHGTSYGFEIGGIVEKHLAASPHVAPWDAPERAARRREVMRRVRAGLPLVD